MDRFCDRCGKKIIKGTLCDYCDGRVDGYRDGYSDGKERGVIEGVSKGRADAIKEMERYIVDHGLYVTFKASEWAEQIKEESDE